MGGAFSEWIGGLLNQPKIGVEICKILVLPCFPFCMLIYKPWHCSSEAPPIFTKISFRLTVYVVFVYGSSSEEQHRKTRCTSTVVACFFVVGLSAELVAGLSAVFSEELSASLAAVLSVVLSAGVTALFLCGSCHGKCRGSFRGIFCGTFCGTCRGTCRGSCRGSYRAVCAVGLTVDITADLVAMGTTWHVLWQLVTLCGNLRNTAGTAAKKSEKLCIHP